MNRNAFALLAFLLVCGPHTVAANPVPCCSLSAFCNETKSTLIIRLTVTRQCLLARDAGLALNTILLRKDDQLVVNPQWILFSEQKDHLVVGIDLPCSATDGRHKYEVDATAIAKLCRLSTYVGQTPPDLAIPLDQTTSADLRDQPRSEGCSLAPRIAMSPSMLPIIFALLILAAGRRSTTQRGRGR
jgi:hypothetical protein